MTDRISELRAVVAEATPGPWERDGHHIDNGHGYVVAFCPNTGRSDDSPATAADARLIAQAPTLATDLAAALEREAKLLAALRDVDALDPENMVSGCSESALRGLVNRMGSIARAALGVQP